MEQLVLDSDIYTLWTSKTDDHRFLHRNKWTELKDTIINYKVKSVLEFGSGVSTLLFENLKLSVTSVETSPDFITFVKSLCKTSVDFRRWDNKTVNLSKHYDLSLVDGILPRAPQLFYAIKHSSIIAVDDFDRSIRGSLGPVLAPLTRIDSRLTNLAIFKFGGK